MDGRTISNESLKVIAQLTRDLTQLRHKNINYLCIENFSTELFAKLLLAYQFPEMFLSSIDQELFEGRFEKTEQARANN